MFGVERVPAPLRSQPGADDIVCLPEPQDRIPVCLSTHVSRHRHKMLPALPTREEMLDKVCQDGECPRAGDAGRGGGGGGGGGGAGGEGEECDGVHQCPQATGVPTKVRKAAVTVPP